LNPGKAGKLGAFQILILLPHLRRDFIHNAMLKYFMTKPNSLFKKFKHARPGYMLYLVCYNGEDWGSKPFDVSIVDEGL
jgi:hypothetical protein